MAVAVSSRQGGLLAIPHPRYGAEGLRRQVIRRAEDADWRVSAYRDGVNVVSQGRRLGGRLLGWIRSVHRRPRYLDVAIAASVFAATAGFGAAGSPQFPHALVRGLVLAGTTSAALVMRRRWPFAVLAVTIAGAEVYLVFPGASPVMLAAPLIALYTVADRAGWRWSLAIGIPAGVVMAGTHAILHPSADFGQDNLTLVAFGGLAVAAGAAARNRRAYTAEVEERARHAEQDREQEARRRVGEERLRIARDLHDVVGHQLALINVQAGVASHVLEEQPVRAKEALDHIMDASRAGLDELRETIALLREPEDAAAPVEPNAGLSGLDGLIATFRRSGLRITQNVEGRIRPVPSATDLTAYRVIQEALTNVRKHAGSASTSVRLGYDATTLRVLVEDDGLANPATGNGSGHGISGMRERVAALGGRLEAGPRAAGGFRVHALLPLPPR